MQSSYRIIKNHNIHSDDDSSIILDGEVNFPKNNDFVKSSTSEDENKDFINLDAYKDEIRNHITDEIRSEILKETESERLKILESAKKEVKKQMELGKNQGFEAGLSEGYNQGYAKAIEEAKAEALIIKNNALRIIEDAESYVSSYYEKSHGDIIKLAAEMAEAIVHNTINESSENIVMLIRPILHQFGKTENIIITCHPESIDYLKLYLHKLEEISPNTTFTILEDGNLEKKGCVIENENKIIDLQIKKQINSILDSIKDIDTRS